MPAKIDLHASLDPDEAKIFLQVLSQLLGIPNKLKPPRQIVIRKVHDALSVVVNEYEQNKNLCLVEIRTKSGSKRGEFAVPRNELREKVEQMASKNKNFVYDCFPANSDLRRTLQIFRK